jgi:hypothetical protein
MFIFHWRACLFLNSAGCDFLWWLSSGLGSGLRACNGRRPLYLDSNMIQEPRQLCEDVADEFGNTHARFSSFLRCCWYGLNEFRHFRF